MDLHSYIILIQFDEPEYNLSEVGKFPRGENEGLRAVFKDSLTKLIAINTREQALKELKTIITQNKTTSNLRTWLSVLGESRNKHNESEIAIFTFILQQYGKGLLDPLDKVPSLERTVFRITEILVKMFFKDQAQNVAIALQKAWKEVYLSVLFQEDVETKKKLLYNNLEAILNGGADKISQISAQFVLEGLLEASLNKQDFVFFKQIAKRTLVLFLKTTIIHHSVLTCLQEVLGYFNINNLIPLLQSIVSKVISYVSLAPVNSNGYRIKSEACNALALIGEQIDQNGVSVQEKVLRFLEDMATDKVWAVQASGRKALAVWKKKSQEWESEFIAKSQQVFNYPTADAFYEPEEEKPARWAKPRPVTADNFMPRELREEIQFSKGPSDVKVPDNSQGRFLHKNTGIGGGNNVQSVEQYYQRQKPQQTYNKKMQQIKKSIFQPKEQYTEFDETVPYEQGKSLPVPAACNLPQQQKGQIPSVIEDKPQSGFEDDERYLSTWEEVIDLFQAGKVEESAKVVIEMDDDIYFLRFMLKYGKGLLKDLTKGTASKVIRRMLEIKKTNFLEQMFFKMVAESAKSGLGSLMTNQQNLGIFEKLEQCQKIQSLQKVAKKLKQNYQNSLD